MITREIIRAILSLLTVLGLFVGLAWALGSAILIFAGCAPTYDKSKPALTWTWGEARPSHHPAPAF